VRCWPGSTLRGLLSDHRLEFVRPADKPITGRLPQAWAPRDRPPAAPHTIGGSRRRQQHRAGYRPTLTRLLRCHRQTADHIHREVAGHVANRLQAAQWREAVHLVAEGVATVGDIDTAISDGPGVRWSPMGPHLTFHLAGGTGGIGHFINQFAGPMEVWWKTLGQPQPHCRNPRCGRRRDCGGDRGPLDRRGGGGARQPAGQDPGPSNGIAKGRSTSGPRRSIVAIRSWRRR